jgi:hypothetical protein
LLLKQEGVPMFFVDLSIRERDGQVVVALRGELDVADAARSPRRRPGVPSSSPRHEPGRAGSGAGKAVLSTECPDIPLSPSRTAATIC